jgi:hypothetical protein
MRAADDGHDYRLSSPYLSLLLSSPLSLACQSIMMTIASYQLMAAAGRLISLSLTHCTLSLPYLCISLPDYNCMTAVHMTAIAKSVNWVQSPKSKVYFLSVEIPLTRTLETLITLSS